MDFLVQNVNNLVSGHLVGGVPSKKHGKSSRKSVLQKIHISKAAKSTKKTGHKALVYTKVSNKSHDDDILSIINGMSKMSIKKAVVSKKPSKRVFTKKPKSTKTVKKVPSPKASSPQDFESLFESTLKQMGSLKVGPKKSISKKKASKIAVEPSRTSTRKSKKTEFLKY